MSQRGGRGGRGGDSHRGGGRGGGYDGGGRGGGHGGGRGGYEGGGGRGGHEGGGRGGYDGGRGGHGGHEGGGRGGYDGGGRGGHDGGRGGYDRGGHGGGRGGYDGGRGGRGGGGGGGRGGSRKIPSIVHLATNMFALNEAEVEKAVSRVCRYDIQILGSAIIPQPSEEATPTAVIAPPTFSGTPKKISKSAMRGITLGMRDAFNVFLVTDAVSTLYSLGELEDPIKKYISSDPVAIVTEKLANMSLAAVDKEPLVFNINRNNKKYAVQVKRVKWDPNDRMEKAQMMQVVVQFSFFVGTVDSNKSVMLTNRNIFMDDRKIPFSDYSDLMLFTGIFQSFRYNALNKPMVNIDVAHFPALRSDISLNDYLNLQAGRNNLLDLLKKPDFVKHINEAISGKLVRARYGNNVTYRLDRLDISNTPVSAKFEITDKKKQVVMSVLDYMQKIKKLTVRHQNQPLIIAKIPPKDDDEDDDSGGTSKGKGKGKSKSSESSKNKTPTWLLPEFLEFSIGEKRKKELSAQERSDMIRLTREEPAERFASIDKNVSEINNNAYWKTFGVKILQKLEVDAKVLTPVELIYSQGVTMTPHDGTWNLDGLKLFETPTTQQKWALVYPAGLARQVDEFVRNFVDLSRVSGYDITKEPEYVELRQGDPNEYVLALKTVAPDYRAKGVAFYLVVLPDKDADRYGRIKAVSNTELGIVTQCVVLDSRGKTSKTSDKSVLGNIVAGINPKLCFQNCIVSPEKLSQALGGRKLGSLMVLGLDVFHGNTQDENRPSVVALCAATNEHFTKYATALRTQSARKEIVEQLDSMVTEVMQEYLLRRRVPPKEIIFYRDGVGEGMYELVRKEEIAQLMRAVGEICLQHKQELPKLTFLVVQKRNHLRSLAKDTPRGNPWPGTLIDDKNVVDGDRPNFYLYSHKALAGTARPTHYQVLEDFNKFTIHQLAEFTYALAHLHQGCTKSVSLPAPVFYADRACGSAGSCYRLQVNNLSKELKNTLFMI